MLWFHKKDKEQVKELERQVTVEVEKAKKASTKEVAKSKKAIDNFNEVIKQNNFTIRVHAAAGGKH